MKSYEPTQKLIDLQSTSPEAAKEIERLCFGLLATRGALIMYEQDATLNYVNRLIEPWVRIVDTKTEANKRTPEQARASVMKRWRKE